jgi:hypothetical protein
MVSTFALDTAIIGTHTTLRKNSLSGGICINTIIFGTNWFLTHFRHNSKNFRFFSATLLLPLWLNLLFYVNANGQANNLTGTWVGTWSDSFISQCGTAFNQGGSITLSVTASNGGITATGTMLGLPVYTSFRRLIAAHILIVVTELSYFQEVILKILLWAQFWCQLYRIPATGSDCHVPIRWPAASLPVSCRQSCASDP